MTTALHTVLDRHSPPHLTSVRAGPDPRLLRPVRIDTVPHAAHPRAVRQEATSRARDLGQRARGSLRDRAHDDLLGRSWAPSVTTAAVYRGKFM